MSGKGSETIASLRGRAFVILIAALCSVGSARAGFDLYVSSGVTTATFSANTYTSTMNDQVVNVLDLQDRLATASISLVAGAGGTQPGDIIFQVPVEWSAATTLNVTPRRHVRLDSSLKAGLGTLVLMAPGGDATFADEVTIANLTVNALGSMFQNAALNVLASLNVDANAVSQSTPMFVNGPATFDASTLILNNATNDFMDAVALTGGTVILADANSLALTASSGTSLTLNVPGTVTQSLPGTVDINFATLLFSGGTLELRFGSNAIQNATLNASGDVHLFSSSASLALNGATISGNLEMGANNITQTAPLLVTGTCFFSVIGDLLLNHASNNFIGAVELSGSAGSNLTIRDSNALHFRRFAADNVTIMAGGSVTQAEPSGGYLNTNVTATGDVILDQPNNFSGPVSVDAAGFRVALNNSFSLQLGNVVANELNANMPGGGIDQPVGALTITGPTRLTASSVTFPNPSNSFGGPVTLLGSGNQIIFADSPIVLDTVTANRLDLTTPEAISQTGAMTVMDFLTLTGGSINLTNAGNQLGSDILLVTTAGPAVLHNSAPVTLIYGTNIAGALTINSGAGELRANGPSDISAAGPITLTGSGPMNLASRIRTTAGGSLTINHDDTLTMTSAVDLDGEFLETGSADVVLNTNLTTTGDNITFTNPVVIDGGVSLLPRPSADVSFASSIQFNGTSKRLNVEEDKINVGGDIGLGDFGGDFNVTELTTGTPGVVNLATGADFVGPGSIIGVVTLDQGNFTPGGTGPIDRLSVRGGVDLTQGTYTCRIHGTEEFESDLLFLQMASVTLDNPVLMASLGGGYVPAVGDRIVIIRTFEPAAPPINGTFANLPEGAPVMVGSSAFRISYVGGDGNDVELTAITTPSVTLGLSGSPLSESGGTATITATLSHSFPANVTVQLAHSGSAALGTDYAVSPPSLVVPSGSTTASVTLTALDDGNDEANETVIVDIQSVTNGTETGTQQVTATITDDDLTVSAVDPTQGRSSGGTSVTITGAGFVSPATVTFGGVAAESVTVNSPTSITAVTAGRTTSVSSTGLVDVVVTSGGSSGTLALGYRYLPFDPNGDGLINVADVVHLLNSLFANGPAPVKSGDSNGDRAVNVLDVFHSINYLFSSAPPPAFTTP